MTNQHTCKCKEDLNGNCYFCGRNMLDTPGGVPTADCTVCGREGGHIMPIQDEREEI